MDEEQESIFRAFFDKRTGWFNTEIDGEDDEYVWGDTEGKPQDDSTASELLSEMMSNFGINSKDFCIKYEDYVTKEDLQ